MITLPYKLLAVLVLLAGIFGAGWASHARWRAAADARAALALSETNRENERLANRNMQRITDALTKDRLASDAAARSSAERLRQLAATSASAPAGCPSRNDDPRPAAAVLSDEVRGDLVAFAQDADAVADRLRACQAGQ